MQEIKYRAWDKKNKKMYEVNTLMIGFGSSGTTIDEDEIDVGTMDDNFIIVQYTGAKDKNDKEIYEGDIIASFAMLDNGLTEVHRGVVEYENSCFCFHIKGKSIHTIFNCYGMLSTELDKKEIIGNVYENEELLTNK